MIERALYVGRQAVPDGDDVAGYQRIYFGEEFCENLLPSTIELQQAVEQTRSLSCGFSLLTPPLSTCCWDTAISLIEHCASLLPAFEVICNDWGLLHYLCSFPPQHSERSHQHSKEPHQHPAGPHQRSKGPHQRSKEPHQRPAVPVAGRLLWQQRRSPGLQTFIDSTNTATASCFKRGGLATREAADFLVRHGCTRVELDNLAQGLEDDFSNWPVQGSLYHPYLVVTMTRLCPFVAAASETGETFFVTDCSRECAGNVLWLKHPAMETDLILTSNAILMENTTLPAGVTERGFDRLVIMQDVPR